MWEDIWQWLVVNKGWLLTVVGIIVGIVVLVLYDQKRAPRYAVLNRQLISHEQSDIEDVEIRYRGQREPITQLSSAQVLIWNSGRKAIKKNDVSSTLRLCILEGCKILRAEIEFRTQDANKFEVAKNRKKTKVNIDFKYMNKGDGVILSIIHTGIQGASLTLEGAIVESEPIKRVSLLHLRPRWKVNLVAFCVLSFFVLNSTLPVGTLYMAIGAFFLGFGMASLDVYRSRWSVPKSFLSYLES